jgi:NAD(P)H-dependent flavin oxidoreductase YrpB (nitropropane dioxygenase family)
MQTEMDRGRAEADPEVAPLWCGAGVGLIHSVRPAQDLVTDIVSDAAATLTKLHGLVQA